MSLLLIKTLHLGFAIAWFAGIFYLPRILLNFSLEDEPAALRRLALMGRRLYRFMHLLMAATLLFGIWLLSLRHELLSELWMQIKLVLVLVLIGYHHICGRFLRQCAARKNPHSALFYRWFNEIPVALLFGILFLAIYQIS